MRETNELAKTLTAYAQKGGSLAKNLMSYGDLLLALQAFAACLKLIQVQAETGCDEQKATNFIEPAVAAYRITWSLISSVKRMTR